MVFIPDNELWKVDDKSVILNRKYPPKKGDKIELFYWNGNKETGKEELKSGITRIFSHLIPIFFHYFLAWI